MVLIEASRAFDGDRLMDGPVVVRCDDGRIVSVEPGTAPDGPGVLRFPGATVLPGLIDVHVHLCGDSTPTALDKLDGWTPEDLHGVIDDSLAIHLAAGVTTVRDLGDRDFAVVDKPRSARQPTVVAAGPPITCPRGHCWFLGGEVSGPDALRAAVKERVERGADVVKIMVSGGMLTPGTDVTACQFTYDEVRTVVEEAHAAGLPVTAHAHALSAVERAVQAGVDGIEHGSCIIADGCHAPDSLLRDLAVNGTHLCPTLGVVGDLSQAPPRILEMLERFRVTAEARWEFVGSMHTAGVTLVSGTDGGIAPNKPHGILPVAVHELVKSGADPAYALHSATALAAETCRLGDRKGRLLPGYDADLLIVDGDPTADITALMTPRAVVLAGEPVHGAA